MTKEEFQQLQSDHKHSGLSLKSYLQQIGTSFSTYNYWRKKYCSQDAAVHDLAPIVFRQPSSFPHYFSDEVSPGATVLFPNGIRVHFGSGSEDVLRELLDKSLMSNVLP